jgi:hypothetical protein
MTARELLPFLALKATVKRLRNLRERAVHLPLSSFFCCKGTVSQSKSTFWDRAEIEGGYLPS